MSRRFNSPNMVSKLWPPLVANMAHSGPETAAHGGSAANNVLAAIPRNRLLKFIQNVTSPPQFLNDAYQTNGMFNPAFVERDVQDQLLIS
uniref:Uncharacterized protein n=1 Tax=Cannabis sativa TaxID=3483 RepID=A0A803P8K8_CANSA